MKIDFRQVTEFLNKLDIKFRYAIFLGVLLLILFIDFFTLMNLQWGAIEKMGNDNQTLQQNIERLKSDMQRINQMKDGLQKNRTQLEIMNVKIRPVGEISSLVDDMSSLANEVGVRIDQLTPQPEGPKSLASNESAKYYVLPIVVQASSSYHKFGHFLNRLELGKFLFMVPSLSIEDRDGDIHHHLINANLKVVLSEKNTDGKQK